MTGVSSGIGLATAQRLLAEGGSVVGTDLTAPPELGEHFTFSPMCPTRRRSPTSSPLCRTVSTASCTLAGLAAGGPVHLLDKAEWDRVIAINLTGTFLVAKAALATMIEQPRIGGERGSIVTLASVEGLEGTAGRQRIQRLQGRCRAAHQEYRARLRSQRHPRKRHLPRLHLNAHAGQRLCAARNGDPLASITEEHALHRLGPPREIAAWPHSLSPPTRLRQRSAIAVDGGYTVGRDHGVVALFGFPK